MVHVRKCPCKYGRGRPTTEFYKDGKLQIYCYGVIDSYRDDYCECCKNCKDWVDGEQAQIDFDEHRKELDRDEHVE